MRKKSRRAILAIVFLAVMVIPLFIYACGTGNSQQGSISNEQGTISNEQGPQPMKPVEINEYQGEKLSSVNDFSENSIKGPQNIDINSYQLQITGLVQNPASYTYNEITSQNPLYKKVVTLNCVEGWSVNILWEGPLVKDLIKKSIPQSSAKVVIFHAYDGYTTSFPLDYITNNDIILAYKMNDIPLPPERGFPFQLVAESKWGYKWIKWVTQIELSDNVNYRGYWESNGYSNEGDLDKSFFD